MNVNIPSGIIMMGSPHQVVHLYLNKDTVGNLTPCKMRPATAPIDQHGAICQLHCKQATISAEKDLHFHVHECAGPSNTTSGSSHRCGLEDGMAEAILGCLHACTPARGPVGLHC
jgi:hypothetical protein